MYGLEFLTDIWVKLSITLALIGIVLDLISGFTQALANHELSSEKMRVGLWHKCGFIGLIVFGIYLQWAQSVAPISDYLGTELPTTLGFCGFIVLTESVSIYENLKKLNPELPEIPLKKLKQAIAGKTEGPIEKAEK